MSTIYTGAILHRIKIAQTRDEAQLSFATLGENHPPTQGKSALSRCTIGVFRGALGKISKNLLSLHQ